MQLETFQLIDRIVDLNIGEKTITVEAQVPEHNSIFEGHFPGFPIMPGVLLTEAMAQSSGWLPLSEAQKFARYAATWMSQRDFARLVRAVIARDVPYAVVYGVGDNPTRFWDLEPGRAIFGFWPHDKAT